MQDVQYEVAENSIKKRVTQEKSPPRLVTYTPGMNAHELKKVRNHKSGKRQHVVNPVKNRAGRLQFVNEIENFSGSTSEDNTQNDSCGNPQNEVAVVS
jgi:hypothetical protein